MGPDRAGDGRGVVGKAEQEAGAAADQPAQPQVPQTRGWPGTVDVPGLAVEVDQGGSSQEKSPLNPVHQTTLPTSSARRSSNIGGSRSTGASWSSGSAGGPRGRGGR
jgi:hypothetical protein